jgi:formylglycine-generating enzyme required for sulfatase activity
MPRAAMLLSAALSCALLCACAAPKGMVRVPAGTAYVGTTLVDEDLEALNLGLPEPWYVDEHPYHPVHIPTFYIDRTEVTNAAYQAFIDANPLQRAPDDWSLRRFGPGRGELPVVYVSWHDADHYCRWRGARLPTEAEWEKAARGPKGTIYPWGNTFALTRANVSTGPFDRGRARPVGSLPEGASPYGALDMIGNVWEWVADDYAPYPGNLETVDAFGRGYKVTRGLSFEALGHFPPLAYRKVVAVSARASFRGYDHPTARLRDVGFRCVQDHR